MNTINAVIFSYLLGSISFAIVVSKLFNLPDPRTVGSKNPGATNVLRSGNKWASALTLAGDTGKSVLAVMLVMLSNGTPMAIALSAFAVLVGHMYPIFFRFQGGKGVATALGVLMVLNIWLGLGVLITWLWVFYKTRVSSLSALSACMMAPIYAIIIFGFTHLYTGSIVLISAIIIFKHKDNIIKLRNGTEKASKF